MKKKHKIIACLCVCALVLGYFFVTFFQQQGKMDSIGAQNAELEAKLEELRLRQAALESDLENAEGDAYIERLAREELGFVKDGEIKFVQEDNDTLPDEE